MNTVYRLSQKHSFLCNRNISEDIITIFIKDVVFFHVGISWMIQSKKKKIADDNFSLWCEGVPWFNAIFCHNLHGSLFEDLFLTASQYRFDLMCGLNAHDNIHDTTSYLTIYSGVMPIPIDETIFVLKSLVATI